MPRHSNYVPHGVIPACLLPFFDDLSIDEASFRRHLSDVASVSGVTAITINAHATEVASCTFDEQRRVLDIAQDEIGDKLPLVNGIWADGSLEAARLARMAEEGGASALLVFPPPQRRRDMAIESESMQANRRKVIISLIASAPLAVPSFGKAAASGKVAQTAAGYQQAPKGGQACAGCNSFVGPNHCKLVAGEISPSGWCRLWTAKAG